MTEKIPTACVWCNGTGLLVTGLVCRTCGGRGGPPPPKPKRKCNRHDDCDAADVVTLARGGNPYVTHCSDETCEDCFGC